MKIDGEYLSHLRFADDVLICASTPHELQHLNMNMSQTRVMTEYDTPIYVYNTQIENVESYIYLGQR